MAQQREVRQRAVLAWSMIAAVVALDWALKFAMHRTGHDPIVLHAAEFGTLPQLGLALVIVLSAHTTMHADTMNRIFIVGWSVAVGGAIGNFGELIALGRVTDFIHLPILQADDWYASPADLAVWGGSAVLALGCLLLVGQIVKQALRPSRAPS